MDSMQFWKDLTKLIEYAGNKLKDENSDTGSLRKIQLFLKSTSPQCSFNKDYVLTLLYCISITLGGACLLLGGILTGNVNRKEEAKNE